MISRTHGQPATPTTVGKEFANFAYRLTKQTKSVERTPILGKFNGAVGNFNAHVVAYPDVDWAFRSQDFVQNYLELEYNPFSTQIEVRLRPPFVSNSLKSPMITFPNYLTTYQGSTQFFLDSIVICGHTSRWDISHKRR
jgi:adenylosuccinate lyase